MSLSRKIIREIGGDMASRKGRKCSARWGLVEVEENELESFFRKVQYLQEIEGVLWTPNKEFSNNTL